MKDDKITRVDMGKAFNTWLKEQPDAITDLRQRVAFANELAGGYDNRGNHVLGAFLTGILQEYDKVVNENLELKHQINELQLQVGDWKDAAEQTIAAARGTMIDAAGERQLRQLVDSVIAYQKENAQLFEVNAQLADVIENFIAAQGTSKEDDAYTALCAYPRHIIKSWKGHTIHTESN